MGNLAILAQQPPLVGREGELTLLEERLDEAFAGRGGLVLLSGEAGIGKSSLADEFGKRATKKGARAVVGKCIPTATSAYLPFQDALRKLKVSGKRELGLMGWLKGSKLALKEEGSHGLGNIRELDSGRTLFSALEFLQSVSQDKALLLILDDLHWADSSSIELLHFLARNCRNANVLIVGTYRPEDIAAKSGTRSHPLLESLTAMRREGIVLELELDRLSLRELQSLTEALIGVPPEQEILRRIEHESGGNPLFAVEIIRLLGKADAIRIQGESWRIVGQFEIDIPSTIQDLVMRRLEQLSREERRILEYGSVIGERFDPVVLAEALGVDNLELLEGLDSLQKSSRLVRAVDGAYCFNHEKIRQVAYNSISAPRRRELHKRIGGTLESLATEGTLPGELSAHFCRAGDSEKCARYSLLAGKDSLNRFAFRDATEYFQTAIDSARDHPGLRDELLEALEGLADSHTRLGFTDQAGQRYEECLRLSGDRVERARVLRKLAECLVGLLKDFSRPLHLLDEAEKFEGIEKVEIGRIASLRATIAENSGAYNEFDRLSSVAGRIFEETGSVEDLAHLLLGKAEVLLSAGRVSEALEELEHADNILSRIGNPRKQMTSAWDRGVAYFHLGMVDNALESYQKGLEIASKFGVSNVSGHIFRGLVYYSIDEFESARVEAARGIDECVKYGATFWHAVGMALLATCETHLNRLSEADEALQQSLEIAKSITSQERTPFRSYQNLAQAELHAARMEWALSNEEFRRGIQSVKSRIFGHLFEAIARTRFGEALIKQGQIHEAQEQFAEAAEIYKTLGNGSQLERVRKLEGVSAR